MFQVETSFLHIRLETPRNNNFSKETLVLIPDLDFSLFQTKQVKALS